MDGLKNWNSKLLPDKIFAEFRIHMMQEYSDFQDVEGLTVNNSLLNQTNMIK